MGNLSIILTVTFIIDGVLGININMTGLELDRWWGTPDMIGHCNTSIRPFRIHFSEKMIKDLKTRLHSLRDAKPPLKGVGFRYGYNSSYVHEWSDYWADEYPFEEREQYLNRFPMYKTNIQGLDVQFIWVKPQVPHNVPVIPLLMMHGWPGSIREFYEAIPLITRWPNGHDFAVELVVPQLPGFGFSDPTYLPGLGSPEAGVIMRNLMRRLGHEQFYVQGGDFGAVTGSYMATMFPEAFPSLILRLDFLHTFWKNSHQVPIRCLFTDCPTAGQRASAEFRDYPDGGLSSFNKDPILDNIMMYWAPNAMTTAIRFYAETFNKRNFVRNLDAVPTPVPTWALQAKHELIYQSPSILKLKFPNLLKARPLDFGIHFFAFDNPEFFSDDVLNAIGEFRMWHQDREAYFATHPVDPQELQRDRNARGINNFIEESGILKLAFDYLNLS